MAGFPENCPETALWVVVKTGRRQHSRKQKAALGFRDGAAEVAGGFEPFGDDGFGVGDGFLASGTVRGAASITQPSQLGHLGYERLVFVAPIEDDLVLCRSASSASLC